MKERKTGEIHSIDLQNAPFKKERVDSLTLINLFFGDNGTGKTQIARAVKNYEELLQEGSTIEVFDREFIKRNVASFGDLPGIYTVGADNVAAQESIQKLQASCQQLSLTVANLEERGRSIQKQKEELLFQFQKVCWEKTADLRKTYKNIRGLHTKKLLAQGICEVQEEGIVPQDPDRLRTLYWAATDKNSLVLDNLTQVQFSEHLMSHPGRRLLGKSVESFGKSDFSLFMRTLKASDWVRSGYTKYAMAAKGRCPYCQQPLPLDFDEMIRANFDEEYCRMTSDLEAFYSVYQKESQDILGTIRKNTAMLQFAEDSKPEAMPFLSDKKSEYAAVGEQLKNRLEINNQRLLQKVKEPSLPVSLEDTSALFRSIQKITEEINRLIASSNEAVSQKEQTAKEVRTALFSHLAFLVKEDLYNYRKTQKSLDEQERLLLEEKRKTNAKQAALLGELEKLRQSFSSSRDAMEKINALLKREGFAGFFLQSTLEPGRWQVVYIDGSPAASLSEGEKSFLSFLYYCQLLIGTQKDKKDTSHIAVLDDPVDGMDENTSLVCARIIRDLVRSCLKNEGKKSTEGVRQIFLFTHSRTFFRALTRGYEDAYESVSIYHIVKTGGISRVRFMADTRQEKNINPVRTDYEALWQVLREPDVQKNKQRDSALVKLDAMRRILFMYFVNTCGYSREELPKIVQRRLIRAGATMEELLAAKELVAFSGGWNSFSKEQGKESEALDQHMYQKEFQAIFYVLGQKRHYQMMMGLSERE